MSWDHQQYVDFIKKHAPAAVRSSLLQANSKPFVPKDNPKPGKPPKIFATYYSMPDWLDIFSSQPKSLASTSMQRSCIRTRCSPAWLGSSLYRPARPC